MNKSIWDRSLDWFGIELPPINGVIYLLGEETRERCFERFVRYVWNLKDSFPPRFIGFGSIS